MTGLSVEVNGTRHTVDVEPRLLLADFLRDHLRLTGTHIGCEHGVCGTCTVQIDGKPARSCLALAVQVDGTAIRTVEALAPDGNESLHPLQAAFHEHHALQCGYCTPGFLMSIEPLLPELRGASEKEVREQLSGNLCRCTGYQNIVEATQATVAGLEAVSVEGTSQLTVEVAVETPHDVERAWAMLVDPVALLQGFGASDLVASGPTSWRIGFAAETGTVDGLVELIDLDDDRRVANFDLNGRTSGAGQVRGTLTLSLSGDRLWLHLTLDLIGIADVPPTEVVERRLRDAGHAWLESLDATDTPHTIVPQRSAGVAARLGAGLVLAAGAWVAWRRLRSRR